MLAGDVREVAERACLAECGDLVPVEAGFEEDFLGVLAKLGRCCADRRWGTAEADWRANSERVWVGGWERGSRRVGSALTII